MSFIKLLLTCLALVSYSTLAFAADVNNPLSTFKDDPLWTSAAAVNAVGNKLQVIGKKSTHNIIVNSGDLKKSKHLASKVYFGDTLLTMEYLLPQESSAKIFLQGRYAITLTPKSKNNEWQKLSVKFRAPRFNEASEKSQSAFFLEVRINGELVGNNQLINKQDDNAITPWESSSGPTTILASGPFAFRHFNSLPADYSNVIPPEKTGGTTNAAELIDYVVLGKETFEAVGCNVCHTTTPNNTAASTGPNLFGLFRPDPRTRDIVEGGEGHRFTIKANHEYLVRSIRSPTDQLAIEETGTKKGEAYPALMPPISAEVVSDMQIEAIGAYLATLNEPQHQGPVTRLMKQGSVEKYDPINDRLQLLVDDQVRIQRGPLVSALDSGASARAIHVGLVNSINYSFDPRSLAIVKVWQGGFLDMTGEFTNRGGKGLKLGFESREINLGAQQYLVAPLNSQGNLIDFSFKNAKFGDAEVIKKSIHSTQDHLTQLAEINAQFLGYTRNSKDKQQAPIFHYRVGENLINIQTVIAESGDLSVHITGELQTAQIFSINNTLLQTLKVNVGELTNSVWTLASGKINAQLKAKIAVAANTWHAPKSTFDNRKQPLKIVAATANLPAGYSIENYYPPKDNFGREQLFEALGLSLAADGTQVVATRTAGIWRLVKGEWQLFAEGTFDSLGVLIEDKKGLTVVVGQKAELTRISDTNGDGIADNYETLFDAHSYHGNYHSYMHGPVRGADGAYYININLADGSDGFAYNAGGKYMGSVGGFSGWNIRVDATHKKNHKSKNPNNKNQTGNTFTPWAPGLRSPAGIALSPDGRLWYSENQGEYVGTSKIFEIQQDKFYGHPSSLIDLPGMTPNSPEITWSKVANQRVMPAVLLPHNRVANSPGNPAWDTTQGKFGPFAGQMMIGDQTQSNLLRVSTELVDGTEQGSVMPFIDGLESGVMRPLFLPDGSLLLGQTGRGWQAKGGHVASLQRILWDGKTVAPAIRHMRATAEGFNLELTQPLSTSIAVNEITEQVKTALSIASWVYRDAPDYGSEELGLQQEIIAAVAISEDRKLIKIRLGSLAQAQLHPQQTARVYHATFTAKNLFEAGATEPMHAYYTLYKFPVAKK
jgi:hypothetical protein